MPVEDFFGEILAVRLDAPVPVDPLRYQARAAQAVAEGTDGMADPGAPWAPEPSQELTPATNASVPVTTGYGAPGRGAQGESSN